MSRIQLSPLFSYVFYSLPYQRPLWIQNWDHNRMQPVDKTIEVDTPHRQRVSVFFIKKCIGKIERQPICRHFAGTYLARANKCHPLSPKPQRVQRGETKFTHGELGEYTKWGEHPQQAKWRWKTHGNLQRCRLLLKTRGGPVGTQPGGSEEPKR